MSSLGFAFTPEEKASTQSCMNRVRDATYLHDLGRLEESERICRELLAEEISLYFRMRVLMLLYSLREDWMEKESLRTQAEAICASLRAMYPRGMFEVVDATLSAAEEKLEEMAQDQAEDDLGPDEDVVFWTNKTRASMRTHSGEVDDGDEALSPEDDVGEVSVRRGFVHQDCQLTQRIKQYEEEEEAEGEDREVETEKHGGGGEGERENSETEEKGEGGSFEEGEKSGAGADIARGMDEEQDRYNEARVAKRRQTLDETYERLLRAGLIGPDDRLE